MPYPFGGGGDYIGFGLPAGGGSPYEPDLMPMPPMGLGGGDPLSNVVAATPFRLVSAYDFAPLDAIGTTVLIGREGGYYLDLTTPIDNFFTPGQPHTVRLVDSTNQTWPLLRGGCYGAVPTMGHVLLPRNGGRSLRFATPSAPEGLYTIRVTRPDWQLDIPVETLQLRVIPAPYSREVSSVRATFPIEVYNPYPD
jgi:hypothetical protein